nr:MAG TPA: hypothetical protein [Caudoviricetes sp.]
MWGVSMSVTTTLSGLRSFLISFLTLTLQVYFSDLLSQYKSTPRCRDYDFLFVLS